MTARSTWKGFERRCAARLGGRRIPVTGIDRHGEDVVHPVFGYQVKLRRGVPSYLREWLTGIVGTAKANNRIGVVIWKEPGKRDDEAIVVLRLKDWQDLHGVESAPRRKEPENSCGTSGYGCTKYVCHCG
jgi:hypothetical protein